MSNITTIGVIGLGNAGARPQRAFGDFTTTLLGGRHYG